MVVQRVPLGFMSAQYEEPVVQPQARRWVLFFSSRMGGRSHELPQSSTGCYGWLVSFLEGAKLHLLGELSFYQQERKTTLLARHLTSSQSEEQREVDECGGKTRPRCYARGLNYSCYCVRLLVDSSCDFKYSYNLERLCVNLEDFSVSKWDGLSVLTCKHLWQQTTLHSHTAIILTELIWLILTMSFLSFSTV